jgi:hypothetical protein
MFEGHHASVEILSHSEQIGQIHKICDDHLIPQDHGEGAVVRVSYMALRLTTARQNLLKAANVQDELKNLLKDARTIRDGWRSTSEEQSKLILIFKKQAEELSDEKAALSKAVDYWQAETLKARRNAAQLQARLNTAEQIIGAHVITNTPSMN